MLRTCPLVFLGPGEVRMEECGGKMDEASRDLQVFLFEKECQPAACMCACSFIDDKQYNYWAVAGEGTWMQFLVAETCQWSCGTLQTSSRTLVVCDPLFP